MINNHENIKNNSNKSTVYNTVISKHCCGVNNEKEGGGGCCKEREGNLDIYKYVGGSKKVSHRPIPPKGDTCANKPHHW